MIDELTNIPSTGFVTIFNKLNEVVRAINEIEAKNTTKISKPPCPNCTDFQMLGNKYCRDCGRLLSY
jgi:hypothetical protein